MVRQKINVCMADVIASMLGQPLKRYEADFLGTSWWFVELHSGETFWVNTKTATIVESSRMEAQR